MKISAPAKLNLCLDILKKTSSGYHEIRTVFHELNSLSDELEITEIPEPDNVSITQGLQKNTYTPPIPMHENLAYKALLLFKKTYNINGNASISIRKNIPMAAGLGGASSNAAAVLKGLNVLWGLSVPLHELAALGAELGADVPFFITGGTALGTHFGEKITPLRPIKCLSFELLPMEDWPRVNLPASKTRQMYRNIDISKCGQNKSKTSDLLEAVESEDPEGILHNLHNDFETLLTPKRGYLSGSGPAVFTAKIPTCPPKLWSK